MISVVILIFEIIIICFVVAICDLVHDVEAIYEPRREKTGFLHMRKQRRRSASR